MEQHIMLGDWQYDSKIEMSQVENPYEHFKFSMGELQITTGDGEKHYFKDCYICGAILTGEEDYGYKLSFNSPEYMLITDSGIGLCPRCARKLIPILQEAYEKLRIATCLLKTNNKSMWENYCDYADRGYKNLGEV